MSIADIMDRLWRLAPHQRMLSAAVIAATIAGAAGPHYEAIDLVVRASLWFVAVALCERTLEAIRGATWDRRAFIAYLPLPCASLAFFLARETANHVTRSGSLDTFFEAAVSILGLLLVSLVVEARRVAAYDQWLRALRGWWVAFVIIGMLFALLGLTPGRRSQKSDYAYVWAGLVGAVVALTVVMWRDPTRQPGAFPLKPEIASPQEHTSTNGLTTDAASTSTRTRAQSNRAAHPGDPR
jgi:hypothetical protein